MPNKPGPKCRPGLVRAVRLSKDHTKALIEVTYGTSKFSPNERPLDLQISNASEMDKCGLPQATCFVLDRTIWLPWAPPFFDKRDDGTGPVIGRLSDTVMMQLETLKVFRRKYG